MWTVFSYCVFGLLVAAVAGDPNADKEAVAQSVDIFSLDLFKAVAKEGNVVASPVSVSTLLGLLQQGAGGVTLEQLTKTLHANAETSRKGYGLLTRNLKSSDNATLEFANGAFLKNGYEVKKQFKNILEKDFLASVDNVDFTQADKAADTINAWVAQHTHDRITNLVSKDAFNSLTRFVLTNAVYFKGAWKQAFDKANTQDADFYTQTSSPKKVPTMSIKKEFLTGEVQNVDARWLSIPFEGDRFSLVIILPNEKDGLDAVLQGLVAEELSRIIKDVKNNKLYKPEVVLSLPRFKLQSTLELADTLKQLGLPNLFDGADFSGISDEPLAVSKVIQKAEIEVNEEGATASAATAVIGIRITAVRVDPPPLEFQVDRPFVAVLVDGLNEVPLFTSKVADPTAQ